jgi:hypothetical protein
MVANTMMVERTGVGMPGVGVTGVTPSVGAPTGMPVGPNYLMVPRCTFKFEKVTGGAKIYCVCEDRVSVGMVQNLCTMLAGGMCGCYVTMNGMPVCCVNFTMGICRCEATDTGVCITCTSGDSHCCEMIQSCCDCVATMVNNGCTCCVTMNNTPVCCGCCDTVCNTSVPGKKKVGHALVARLCLACRTPGWGGRAARAERSQAEPGSENGGPHCARPTLR